MKINILILVFLILGTGAWTYLSDKKQSAPETAQNKVDDFSFQTLRGEKQALFDQEGRVVLLHFWATWCAPCVEELPKLIELAKANPDQLAIIAVAVADQQASIERFLTNVKKQRPDNFIVALDPDKAISKDMYGTVKLPETYVIRPDLTLLEKVTGAENNWNSADWKKKIHRLYSRF